MNVWKLNSLENLRQIKAGSNKEHWSVELNKVKNLTDGKITLAKIEKELLLFQKSEIQFMNDFYVNEDMAMEYKTRLRSSKNTKLLSVEEYQNLEKELEKLTHETFVFRHNEFLKLHQKHKNQNIEFQELTKEVLMQLEF